MSLQTRPRAPNRRWLLVPVIVAALALAYALAGFVLAPWVAERELPRLVEQQLHQRARIGEISFNPFTLRLHAREFALETMEGRPVLGFTDAVVGFRWLSLLRRGWVLEEVRLVDPAVHLEIAKDGRLNLATLVPDTTAADSTQPARFAIGKFSVANGSIDFEDHRQGYRDRVERLSIDLASLSTLDAEKGSYALSGQTPGGATLRWKGEIALTPLAVTGTLVVGNAGLTELRPYVDDFTEVRVVAGRADLELPYRFSLEQGKPRLTLKGAKLALREFALSGGKESALLAKFGEISLGGIDFDSATQRTSVKAARVGASTVVSGKDMVLLATVGPVTLDGAEFALATRRGSAQALGIASAVFVAGDETKPLAGLRQLALDDAAFDLGSQRVSAKGLRVADLMLALERDANGELDLLRMFPGKGGGAAGGEKPGGWQASIGAVEIANGSARYTDRTAKTPLALVADGFSGSFSFDATSGAQGTLVRVDAGIFALAKLDALAASAPRGSAQQPAAKLAKVSLAGARYDSGANALEVDTVRLGSLGVDTALENGRASLLDLVPAAGKSKSEKPLSARVKAFELGEGGVSVADRASGIAFALGRLTGKLRDISTDRAHPLVFDLAADVKSGGRIALRGRAVPAQGTVEAKIEAVSIALAPVQSILARYANVKLGSGDVSLSGTIRVGGKDAKLAFAGGAGIANLALDDAAGVRLLGWKSLATESLKATLSPDRVDIDELRLTAPAGRLAIAKDGTSNISRAFAKNQAAVGAGAPPPIAESAPRAAAPDTAPAATDDEAKPGQEGAVVVAVRRVRVEQGALDFSDDSLSPGFVAKIYELAGTANGLSSDRDARSQFALEGRVDDFGYARLSGSVNPFVPRNRSTFRVELRNVDLATASPYSMRFAGYRIATGRLTADLNYRVRANVIEGDNKITLDKLTLGERVESPDALKLPFELAIALLKDPDGTISLELPVNGNLDDPQFSLAPLIWKAVGHLIGNIVAAPFRALAHLFGGGGAEGEGGVIAFDPGKSRLLPPEQEKLGHIVQVLAKRPELKLVIPAHFDTEADARAMKRAALGREIGRRAGFALAQDDEPGPVNVEDKPTRAALRAIFTERFSKAELDKLRAEAEAKAGAAGQAAPSVTEKVRNFASGEPQIVDAREFYQTLLRRVRDAQALPANALAELAQQRALAIEAALQAAGADASRMSRTIAAPTAEAEAKAVTVHLSLAAR
jgi:Domain of Unknown Function (DUF748)